MAAKLVLTMIFPTITTATDLNAKFHVDDDDGDVEAATGDAC